VFPDQPLDPVEAIKGAKSRAKAALELVPEAAFGVGLEGGLEQVDGLWFDCGWCVVLNRQGEIGIGSSARIPTPESMMKKIRSGQELGEVIDQLFNTKNAKHDIGHFGLMTDGAITRIDGYTHAVCFALSRFLHPELFTS
jgi:inosine/xanthosine triphosphatase